MARVEGLEKVQAAMRKLAGKYPEKEVSVVVGCTQRYALFVHENLQARHPVGQAKFLESPARRYASQLAGIVRTAVSRGVGVLVGLKMAGLKLMQAAQLLTPVDTSALKPSYFVVAEEGLEMKSEEMFAKSETVRKAGLARQAKMTGRQIKAMKARQRVAWLKKMKSHK